MSDESGIELKIARNTQNEITSILELGSIKLNITKGLELVQQKNNCTRNKTQLFKNKYIIVMVIFHNFCKNAVNFIEIESNLSKNLIKYVLLQKLKYKLPKGEKINQRNKFNYIFKEVDDSNMFVLKVLDPGTYISLNDSNEL